MSKKMRIQVDHMDSPERVEQLEKIDQLRELGVGEEINLPQLVVVGDQSSGKSSLLEGLTGLPFPVASELCTRFATQIVFRRAPTSGETITVSIIPAANYDDAQKKSLGAFSRSLTEFSAETFAEVLDEAAVCMGLPGAVADLDQITKRFSSDVLKIEISGPQQHHLSFVDVPGLFHNPTKYQTSDDRLITRELIEGYVEDRRTIIMAVMDARNNLANQEVFRIAKAADKEGIRTVGIMTKCDALQKGDEPAAIRIAQNLTERLTHGWFCVRNRSTTEIQSGVTIEQRHENERKFFASAPWNVLDKKRVGISALKVSLGRLLSDHVANEFPEIRKEIDDRFSQARKELEQLGAPRQTAHEQMQYLIRLAGAYQRQVEDALNGRYAAEGTHPSKLRMHVKNANERFNDEMHAKGCTMAFRSTEESLDDISTEDPPNPFAYIAPQNTNIQSNGRPRSSRSESPMKFEAGPDHAIIFGAGGKRQPKSNIYEDIRQLYQTSKGTELPGHVNPTVLETLFAHQTTSWQSIADNHIGRVISLIWDGLEAIFVRTCLDDGVRKKIRSRIGPEMDESVTRAHEELERLLDDERKGHLITNNHYFADNLAKARAERFVAGMKKLGFEDGAHANINFKAMTAMVHLSNEASAIYDIHDTLAAYYKVALKRFIDNVVLQVVERNLLGPNGPANIFGPDYVGALSAGDLASIAAEDFATSNTRTELRFQISRLEVARKVCSGRSSSNGI